MKTLLAATAAAALTLSTGPLIAQDAMEGQMMEMTSEQQTMYDGWPEDRQTMYDGWPAEAQTYYWTLTPPQAEAWWVLTNEQRVQVLGMTEDQRAQTWTSVIAQINGTAPAPATAAPAAPAPSGTAPAAAAPTGATAPATTASATSAPTATSAPARSSSQGNVRYVSEEVSQLPKKAAVTGELPVCTPDQQDGCING